ncbi:hypothetical protein RJT34_02025 [Clitoria ternatea]|uniref:Uncharacterized protein n=1 Tax=Clitoria ternatea TaxID=43366 RepID=A0AAN9Q3N2_CLITE
MVLCSKYVNGIEPLYGRIDDDAIVDDGTAFGVFFMLELPLVSFGRDGSWLLSLFFLQAMDEFLSSRLEPKQTKGKTLWSGQNLVEGKRESEVVWTRWREWKRKMEGEGGRPLL